MNYVWFSIFLFFSVSFSETEIVVANKEILGCHEKLHRLASIFRILRSQPMWNMSVSPVLYKKCRKIDTELPCSYWWEMWRQLHHDPNIHHEAECLKYIQREHARERTSHKLWTWREMEQYGEKWKSVHGADGCEASAKLVCIPLSCLCMYAGLILHNIWQISAIAPFWSICMQMHIPKSYYAQIQYLIILSKVGRTENWYLFLIWE